MPTVHDVLRVKGRDVHCIDAGQTVLEATKRMNQHKVGALVVMDGERVAGIFTERDVLRRVVAEERAPADLIVREVMTQDVIYCELEADLDDIAGIMRQQRIRHIPVCGDDGGVLGMISIGDVNAHYASTQQQTIHFLSDYIYGRA